METARDDPQSPDEDPRETEVGEGGYPEEQHPGAAPGGGKERHETGDEEPDED